MKFIKNLVFLLSVCAVCLTASTAFAEKLVYNIGVLDDCKFQGNDISQYAHGCINSMLEYMPGNLYDTKTVNVKDGIEAVNNGNIDIMCMVPKSDVLSQSLDYTNNAIGKGFLTLFTYDESSLYYESFSDFDGIRIAMLRDSVYEKQLSEYALRNDFIYTPVYFDTMSEAVEAVNAHIADAVLTPSTNKPDSMRLIAKCGEIDYYAAVKKGNIMLLTELNDSLEQLKAANPFYIYTDYEKFLTTPYRNIVGLTNDEYKARKNHTKLRVLASEDDYPVSYFDSSSGRYAGTAVDILDKIAQNSGFEIEYMPYNQNEMSMNGIVMGKADVILKVSGSKQGLITATEPYTSISYIPISKKSTNVFEDSRMHIGILENDSWTTDYFESKYPQWYIEKYSSVSSLLKAVENDKVSTALISYSDMQTKTSLLTHPDLSVVTDFDVSVPVSLGVSSVTCNQYMVNLLDKTIKSVYVPQAEMESKIYGLSHIFVPSFRDMLFTNKLWIVLILIAFLALIVIIKLREVHYKRLARTDALTQIPNKRYFMSAAFKMLEKNSEQSYLIASVDARNFKLINDRFGHAVGDQTLKNIASQIEMIFKDKGLYARSQGDSFLILTEDTTANRERIEKLTELNIYIHNTSKYPVSIKIGVCPIAAYNPTIGISGYVDRANLAKGISPGGSTTYLRYFTEDMEEQLEIENTIESEMVHALSAGEFIVYYQPKYDLSNDKIIGAEALVRWNNRDRGIIPPGMFIPVFEKNGFVSDLDFYVYESVLKMLRTRLDANKPVIPISMNVSRCHLGDTEFVNKLEALVKKYAVPKEYVEMEITESIFSREDTEAVALIYQLKEHGFTISMDDFGSGYSSLNLLRKVPIDTLKIDKEFIDNTDNSPRGQAIVEEIICMASKINVKTICEGVETETQRDFLKRAGCNMVQGFFYSRPLPYESFSALLNSSI